MASAGTIMRKALPIVLAAGLGLGCGMALEAARENPGTSQSGTEAAGSGGEEETRGAAPRDAGSSRSDAMAAASATWYNDGIKAAREIPGASQDGIKAAGSDGKEKPGNAASKDSNSSDSSNSRLDAVADVPAATWYNDGTYMGTGKGMGGDVTVIVTVRGGVITDVSADGGSEPQGSEALEQMPARIVEANGTKGVDLVSGASVTSRAILTGAYEALLKAGTTDVQPQESVANGLGITVEGPDDHLGTQRFGELSVTIPDGYECESFENASSGDASTYRAAYSGPDGNVIVQFYHRDGLADLLSPDIADEAIQYCAQHSSISGRETVTELHIDSSDETGVYYGTYAARYEERDILMAFGAAFDTENDAVLVFVVPTSASQSPDERSDGYYDLADAVILGITGGVAPSALASPASSGSFDKSARHDSWRGDSALADQGAPGSALNHLEGAPFSRDGLVSRLELEGYDADEAEAAVDQCGADWGEQAVRMAGEYLDAMTLTRSQMIKQLEFEGFTPGEASAAADALGL